MTFRRAANENGRTRTLSKLQSSVNHVSNVS
jgi:hypothetical protein